MFCLSSLALPLEQKHQLDLTTFCGKAVVCFQQADTNCTIAACKQARVIVVGSKSADKSSVLELITKCPIFPRHSDFWTEMPMKLQPKCVSKAAQHAVTLTFQGKSTKLELTEVLPEINKTVQ